MAKLDHRLVISRDNGFSYLNPTLPLVLGNPIESPGESSLYNPLPHPA